MTWLVGQGSGKCKTGKLEKMFGELSIWVDLWEWAQSANLIAPSCPPETSPSNPEEGNAAIRSERGPSQSNQSLPQPPSLTFVMGLWEQQYQGEERTHYMGAQTWAASQRQHTRTWYRNLCLVIKSQAMVESHVSANFLLYIALILQLLIPHARLALPNSCWYLLISSFSYFGKIEGISKKCIHTLWIKAMLTEIHFICKV